ncbi:MAG: HisA/HisF-related TIM barrel protein [Candidatus Helarchaeota archaeon]
MRIIPVLDILKGQVVHGVRGERNKYVPIQSILTPSSDPLEVAKVFKKQFPISELYIADLDAIMHQQFAVPYLEQIIAETKLKIMIDPGVDEPEPIASLLEKKVNKVIIGTETLRSISNLQRVVDEISPRNIIVSLDLKEGKILTKAKELRQLTPINAIHYFEDIGIQELIVLELTKVGSESGVMTQLLENILQTTSIPIITGGGARNIQDLVVLKNAGIAGVLIATALHKGAITPQDLSHF